MSFTVEARYRRGHAQAPALLRSPDDVDAMIDALLAGPEDENLAQLHSLERDTLLSGSPDHELLVGVDRTLQVGILTFMDAGGNWVTVGSPGSRDDVDYFILGHWTDLPGRSEVPLELVRRAVKEFCVVRGQRPACVRWDGQQ
ncbi:Imm1 family immunity protein [Jidongwangia harbinensis]|uniref:Imm1 family immunity protein n=1 Tax=Jidongwangia harbinensis TaxID=2878561 RepID=UPI001CDA196B|nr:Imm1 family immunity protein [Jidongwangia harbinensis]MCA2216319.1 hypothetical protein [Jidongwangia harbinensis]MCA2217054.1 hypothetical protein [Jidongwangia harbinensis]